MWAESEQSDDAELGRNGIRLDVGIRELGKGSSGYRRATRMYGAIGIDCFPGKLELVRIDVDRTTIVWIEQLMLSNQFFHFFTLTIQKYKYLIS